MVPAVVAVLLVGVADYLTGRDFMVSAFYTLPIGWACWAAGRRAGIALAVFSAAILLIVDIVSGPPYPHWALPYWNALTLLALFLALVQLLVALKQVQHNLEATVELRTAALRKEIRERQQLELAMVQAERLAVVGTMAAQVAHEVRNPLGSITLNLDLAEKEIGRLAATSAHPAQEAYALVQEIRHEVRRIHHVTDDYLRFARLPKPNRQPLSLDSLLAEKLAPMGTTFEKARVRLRTEFDPAVTTIPADADQIWEAVLNLILNVLEAMPDGGQLLVGTRRDGAHVLVQVTDSGIGMSPQQLAQIFRPFHTTKAQGTGLGLVLVQQIAVEHGGHVECQSALGHGSTFTLWLPAAAES